MRLRDLEARRLVLRVVFWVDRKVGYGLAALLADELAQGNPARPEAVDELARVL